MIDAISSKTRRIHIDGAEMSVIEVGEGFPVVLAHSYLWDAEMWRPQIEALSSRYRIIVPELWGHGGSDGLPNGTLDLKTLARHHLTMLDRLGVERCALVGLSVGGMWAAEAALLAPERISALVLMNTSLDHEPQVARQRYFAMLDIVENLKAVPPNLRQAIIPLFFSPSAFAQQSHLVSDFDRALQRFSADTLVKSIVPLGRIIFGRRDALPDLLSIRCPRLVMVSEDDLARPPLEGARMADWLGCEFVLIPDCGHISTLEMPAFVTDTLATFLEGAL